MPSTTAHTPVLFSESRCALARLQPVFNPLGELCGVFASKFRPEPPSSLTFAGTRAAAHSGVPVPTGGVAASRSAACFIVKGGLLALERQLSWQRRQERSRSAPPPPPPSDGRAIDLIQS